MNIEDLNIEDLKVYLFENVGRMPNENTIMVSIDDIKKVEIPPSSIFNAENTMTFDITTTLKCKDSPGTFQMGYKHTIYNDDYKTWIRNYKLKELLDEE